MSKKLIAIVSAIALSAGFAVSANAVVFKTAAGLSIDATGMASGTGGTLLDPLDLTLPANGKVDGTKLLTVKITSDLKTRAVTITAAKGTLILDEAPDATNKYNAKSGSQTLTGTSTSTGSFDFYAYTTTTAKTKITISYAAAAGKDDSATYELYVQGVETADNSWNLTVDPIKAVGVDKSGFVYATVTDVFGNDITSIAAVAAKVTLTVAGAAVLPDVAPGEFVYDSTLKKLKSSFSVDRSGSYGVGVALTTDTTDTVVDSELFGAAKNVFFTTMSAASLEAQITELTAQVAALQVIVDRNVSKKRYNTLALKWNAANPSAKVALKK